MVKAISIVGPSGTGKTELICRLLDWFGRRGLRVAVLKHTHHQELGDRGKDTWRFRQAGARVTALAAPGLLQINRGFSGEPPISDILAALSPGADLILVEGYKSGPLPKIVVLHPAIQERFSDLIQVLATVSQAPTASDEFAFRPGVETIGLLILAHFGLGKSGDLGRRQRKPRHAE
jgi:molybdopterin-guanine dinucleotide biosynthesis protein MobB